LHGTGVEEDGMDNQTGKDRNRGDQGQQNVGSRDRNVGQEGGGGRDSSVGQQEPTPTGTSGRDADLQREGNLGNERNRNTPDNRNTSDDQEDTGIGSRPEQNR
jgi:hypothetical protein